jgi:UDP-N-acetylmuramate dehydrogenase
MPTLKHSIKQRVSLKKYSTFKIGGKADFFVEVDDLQRLEGVLEWAQDHQQKVFILGGGSNLLFMDEGFDGLVIKLINNNIRTEINNGTAKIRCGAGVSLSKLVATSFKSNLTGLEWAAGIPGTVGGAVRGNAGAFGGEMKDIIIEVQAVSLKNCKVIKGGHTSVIIYPNELGEEIDDNCKNIVQTFNNRDCAFEYRNSVFKESNGLMIWEVGVQLSAGDGNESKKTASENIRKRDLKQPNVTKFPSAGSIFKNPKVSKKVQRKFKHDTGMEAKNGKVPAGWLVGRCELRGQRIGGAKVSEEHGNFIINTGKATAKDVILLISIIKTKVRNKYGVQLQEEICIVH